jgi:hypothetical protein
LERLLAGDPGLAAELQAARPRADNVLRDLGLACDPY